MRHSRTILLLLMLMLSFPTASSAQLQLSHLIGDGMVIQREADVPVWGTAAPGAEVTVTFDGESYVAEADAEGSWNVVLPAMDAGGPYEMGIQSAGEAIEVRDILVGDVWVASGQSNMEWVVADARDAEQEIAAADDEAIRHFKVPRSWAAKPEATLAGGAWEAADPEHVGDFTAVGYFFARSLRDHIDVPIGLINTTWGGSRIEPWMSAETLRLDEDDVDEIVAKERSHEQRVLDRLRQKLGTLPQEDAGLVDGEAIWAAPDLDDSDWNSIEVPALWEQVGYEGMDGVAWYRTTFELTEDEAETGTSLSLGPIDDSDVTWVNGRQVGRMENSYSVRRVYDVPADVLQSGRNVVAVRVEDAGGGGGIYGEPASAFVEVGGERRPLAGDWKFKVGRAEVNMSGRKNKLPTLLYNKMVHPLLPYPIKGVLWYQGESNADVMEDAVAYRDQFADLIESWREAWNAGTFPFLFVQLANFEAGSEPGASRWAVLRESQAAALELPATAQAVTIDIGNPQDIHPGNKQDVGRRLARAARHLAYGEDVVYTGPTYLGHRVEDERVVILFDHADSGLVAEGGDLNGFTIAGNDGRFVPAEAAIDGNQVVVWSEEVTEPEAVRYAWSDNPEEANLYNDEGLPASPFHTDAQ